MCGQLGSLWWPCVALPPAHTAQQTWTSGTLRKGSNPLRDVALDQAVSRTPSEALPSHISELTTRLPKFDQISVGAGRFREPSSLAGYPSCAVDTQQRRAALVDSEFSIGARVAVRQRRWERAAARVRTGRPIE